MRVFQKFIVLISTLLPLSAVPAMAQLDKRVDFTAPFAFYAGEVQMPAGDYTITRPDDNTDVLLVRSDDGTHSAFVNYVPTQSETPADKNDVTFDKQGDAAFLSRISLEGQEYGMQILEMKAERETANAAPPEHDSAPTADAAQQAQAANGGQQ